MQTCFTSFFCFRLSATNASCSDGRGTLDPARARATCCTLLIVTEKALDAKSSKLTVLTVAGATYKDISSRWRLHESPGLPGI